MLFAENLTFTNDKFSVKMYCGSCKSVGTSHVLTDGLSNGEVEADAEYSFFVTLHLTFKIIVY